MYNVACTHLLYMLARKKQHLTDCKKSAYNGVKFYRFIQRMDSLLMENTYKTTKVYLTSQVFYCADVVERPNIHYINCMPIQVKDSFINLGFNNWKPVSAFINNVDLDIWA